MTRRWWRKGLSAEELAAIEAAKRTRQAAEALRAEAADVTEENLVQWRRVRKLRVDNHLGEYVIGAALRGRT